MPGSSAVFATCALALFQIPAPAYWEFTFADSLFTEFDTQPELACSVIASLRVEKHEFHAGTSGAALRRHLRI